MANLDNQDIPTLQQGEILDYLERKLGITSVLVRRLEGTTKDYEPNTNIFNMNDRYVKARSAEVPVFSTREDMQVIPSLPELGSKEPIEDVIANLTVNLRVPELRLPNGIRLSFNNIMSLAGNFYGIEESISDPRGNPANKFMRAFKNLATGRKSDVQAQLDQLMAIMTIERNSVESVLGRGDPSIPIVLDENEVYGEPSEMYAKHGLWFTKQYDMILGGQWGRKKGKVLKLGRYNIDHYQPHSLEVWRVGHELALDKAREAGTVYRTPGKGQVERGFAMLEEAYAMSAFSCNYLVQSFTAGHIRVPVKQLESDVAGYNGYKLGYYHFAEDEKFGLNVINKWNERWTCWGQKKFYDTCNEVHRKCLVKTLQDVVTQIVTAFEDPEYRGDYGGILNQVPEPDTRMQNNFPLFRVADDGRLLRRSDVNDLSCASTTYVWFGGSTLDLVRLYNPMNSVVRSPARVTTRDTILYNDIRDHVYSQIQ